MKIILPSKFSIFFFSLLPFFFFSYFLFLFLPIFIDLFCEEHALFANGADPLVQSTLSDCVRLSAVD